MQKGNKIDPSKLNKTTKHLWPAAKPNYLSKIWSFNQNSTLSHQIPIHKLCFIFGKFLAPRKNSLLRVRNVSMQKGTETDLLVSWTYCKHQRETLPHTRPAAAEDFAITQRNLTLTKGSFKILHWNHKPSTPGALQLSTLQKIPVQKTIIVSKITGEARTLSTRKKSAPETNRGSRSCYSSQFALKGKAPAARKNAERRAIERNWRESLPAISGDERVQQISEELASPELRAQLRERRSLSSRWTRETIPARNAKYLRGQLRTL